MPPTSNFWGATSRALQDSVRFQIAVTVFFTFICYLAIGIPIAVLPAYVHLNLGFGSIWAGLAISMQYMGTFASRPYAGRMCDTVGPKQTVLVGLLLCGVSGLLMLAAAALAPQPPWALAVIMLARLALGSGESMVGTGAITWGIGRAGDGHATRVISFNGIATYGALALGAPLGVLIDGAGGFAAIGLVVALICLAGAGLATLRAPVAVPAGVRLGFREVFLRVLPHGICQALGAIGFGVISAFITLFYACHRWDGAALALSAFGSAFVLVRLLFAQTINRYGGFRVAMVSFAIETVGLLLLWQAGYAHAALAGAALAGGGFALIFPALASEAVRGVAAANRGAALGAYSVFLDLALWAAGPLAGVVATHYDYAAVFLCAALAAALAVALSAMLYLRGRPARSML